MEAKPQSKISQVFHILLSLNILMNGCFYLYPFFLPELNHFLFILINPLHLNPCLLEENMFI